MAHRLVHILLITALTSLLLWQSHNDIAQAQVMQSASYQMESDSINIGGGLSSSTNYIQESTVGEIATGPSDSTSYSLRAGYQQMQEVYLALTAAADVTMSPSIGGVTGGTSTGVTSVTATTDNRAGYTLTIQAESSPAMQSGANSIADYTTGGDPDFVFDTGATESHFGYSPEGAHIDDRFRDDGGSCNTSSGDTPDRCWDGLTTSAVVIATDSNSNHPNGTDTTVKFQVGVGGSVNQTPGTYVATTTLTLLPL